MTLFVIEIRHDGLALGRSDATVAMFCLPANDWQEPDAEALWKEFRDTTEPGMALNVTLVPGRHVPGGLQVVTLRGPGAKELSQVWKGELHALKIESMSKKLIRGRIGAIEAVMERDEYTEFLNHFPHNEHIQDHGALALGDVICGVFRVEHGPEGRVQVSLKDALDRIKKECAGCVAEQSGNAETTPEEVTNEDRPPNIPLFHTPPAALSPFLFVENDDLCREMWKAILEEHGVEVDAYGTYEPALGAIQDTSRSYKMAVLDVHLRSGANDHLGLDLARKILESQPNCRVVLSSAEDNAGHKEEGWGELRVHGYIVKPALLEEWTATIDAAASTEDPSPLCELLPDFETQFHENGAETSDSQHSFSETIPDALNAFSREAPGVIVHVFRLHPRSWRGRSLGNAGGELKWEPYRGKLGKSLIRDAAESKEAVVYNEAGDSWQHQWTKVMVDYQSFWGLQLPMAEHYKHVLVAFHANAGFFTSELQIRARCCAETVTRILSSQQLERRGRHDAEQSSAGLGFACLAHEIYAKLSGVDFAVNRMASMLSNPEVPLEDNAPKLRQTVTKLQGHVPVLVDNARILRGSAGGDKPILVAFCLEKAVTGIQEAMKQLLRHPENLVIDVAVENPARQWTITANAAALVTVFFNVLLNAVQQIEMFSAVRPKGWVRISTQYYEDADGLPWAWVFVSDSGPGIHPDDYELIFHAGHTTKEDGTGLGLHICRKLLSQIRVGNRQATMRIARSMLWAGTTMTIRLPLSTPPKQEINHE